jgi:hypothetical protein
MNDHIATHGSRFIPPLEQLTRPISELRKVLSGGVQ